MSLHLAPTRLSLGQLMSLHLAQTRGTRTPVDGAADELVAYYSQGPDLVSVPQDLLMARPIVRVPDLHRKKRKKIEPRKYLKYALSWTLHLWIDITSFGFWKKKGNAGNTSEG